MGISLHCPYSFIIYRKTIFKRVRKIRKEAISFVMSVCPSVCLHGTTRLPLDGFSWNLILEYFSRRFKFHSVLTRLRVTWRPMYIYDNIAELFLEWGMFQPKVVKKIKHFFMFTNFFIFDNHAIYEVMWKSIIERNRPQMTCALHAGHLRPQTHLWPV